MSGVDPHNLAWVIGKLMDRLGITELALDKSEPNKYDEAIISDSCPKHVIIRLKNRGDPVPKEIAGHDVSDALTKTVPRPGAGPQVGSYLN